MVWCENIGMVVLIDVSCLNCVLVCSDFGFVLGLWVNVGGCVGELMLGVWLLIIEDVDEVCVIVV